MSHRDDGSGTRPNSKLVRNSSQSNRQSSDLESDSQAQQRPSLGQAHSTQTQSTSLKRSTPDGDVGSPNSNSQTVGYPGPPPKMPKSDKKKKGINSPQNSPRNSPRADPKDAPTKPKDAKSTKGSKGTASASPLSSGTSGGGSSSSGASPPTSGKDGGTKSNADVVREHYSRERTGSFSGDKTDGSGGPGLDSAQARVSESSGDTDTRLHTPKPSEPQKGQKGQVGGQANKTTSSNSRQTDTNTASYPSSPTLGASNLDPNSNFTPGQRRSVSVRTANSRAFSELQRDSSKYLQNSSKLRRSGSFDRENPNSDRSAEVGDGDAQTNQNTIANGSAAGANGTTSGSGTQSGEPQTAFSPNGSGDTDLLTQGMQMFVDQPIYNWLQNGTGDFMRVVNDRGVERQTIHAGGVGQPSGSGSGNRGRSSDRLSHGSGGTDRTMDTVKSPSNHSKGSPKLGLGVGLDKKERSPKNSQHQGDLFNDGHVSDHDCDNNTNDNTGNRQMGNGSVINSVNSVEKSDDVDNKLTPRSNKSPVGAHGGSKDTATSGNVSDVSKGGKNKSGSKSGNNSKSPSNNNSNRNSTEHLSFDDALSDGDIDLEFIAGEMGEGMDSMGQGPGGHSERAIVDGSTGARAKGRLRADSLYVGPAIYKRFLSYNANPVADTAGGLFSFGFEMDPGVSLGFCLVFTQGRKLDL